MWGQHPPRDDLELGFLGPLSLESSLRIALSDAEVHKIRTLYFAQIGTALTDASSLQLPTAFPEKIDMFPRIAVIQQHSNSSDRVLKQTTIQLPEPQTAPSQTQPTTVGVAGGEGPDMGTTMGWRMVLTG
jgi:hypothetical protein